MSGWDQEANERADKAVIENLKAAAAEYQKEDAELQRRLEERLKAESMSSESSDSLSRETPNSKP